MSTVSVVVCMISVEIRKYPTCHKFNRLVYFM